MLIPKWQNGNYTFQDQEVIYACLAEFPKISGSIFLLTFSRNNKTTRKSAVFIMPLLYFSCNMELALDRRYNPTMVYQGAARHLKW